MEIFSPPSPPPGISLNACPVGLSFNIIIILFRLRFNILYKDINKGVLEYNVVSHETK